MTTDIDFLQRVTIRPYTATDADVLRAMIAKVREYEISIDPTCRPWEPMADDYFDFLVAKITKPSGRCLIAELDGEIIGFSSGYEDHIDEIFLKDEEKIFAYISDTYVKPEYRRHGLALALNSMMEQYFTARGVRKVRRVVLAANAAINGVLGQAGYSPYEIVYEKRVSA
jgi:ribosomal protein S18 acetylase RimI-like enzyme